MPEEKKYLGDFTNGGGDFDTAPFALSPNKVINMENCRLGTTDAGETGTIESIGSTILLSNPYLPAGTNWSIGNAEDDANSRFIDFNWNSNGSHAIYAYYFQLQSWFIVLTDAQVTGGLTFDRFQLIHSARVINGCVYWVNNLQNPPRRINIEGGIKLNHPSFNTSVSPYTNPLSQSVLLWGRRQPGLPPTASKQIATLYAGNFTQNQAMEFCYRYVYREYEQSKLSGLSNLINFNSLGDNYNYVQFQIPFAEQIDQDVIQIDIVVKFLLTGKYSIIHSFFKNVPADATAIANHNAGTTQLTYNFFNDRAGITLDDAYAATPFDSIPNYAESDETAKARFFLSNYQIGYNAPSITSLAITQNTNSESGQVTGEWFFIRVESICAGGTQFASIYVILIGNLTPTTLNGYYRTVSGLQPPGPSGTHIDWNSLTFVGAGVTDVANAIGISGCTNVINQYVDQGVNMVIDNAPSPQSLVGTPALKSNTTYQAAIVFFDTIGKKCGIVTNDSLKLLSTDRTYAATSFVTSLTWTLSNTNAANEIPVWATDYAVVLTLSLRTRFFLQSRSVNIVYAAKDSSNKYTFTTTVFATNLAGIAIDISLLTSYGMGYVFSQGDLIKLWVQPSGIEVTCSIIDQSAQYVICQLQSVGNLTGATCLFEIYTPYQQQSNEPYYEQGKIYPIANAGTPSRIYSVITDTLPGDIVLMNRSDGTNAYLAEAMSPSDKFYKNWFTNAGRPNFVDTIGQVTRGSSGVFSDTIIIGAQSNGLSSFDALNVFDVFPDCGIIRKIQLTSKVQQQIGGVMLAICKVETASIYLSETQMLSAEQNQFVAQATNVIGTINVLEGSFGTNNPESVYQFKGNVFYWDALNGKIIQYSTNGLFPVSNSKATRFWKLFSDQFQSMTQAQIAAFGFQPFVFICVDPHNWELLVSIPQLLAIPPKGYLPDYPSMIYPFDIWDGQAKTLVYKLNADPNFWQGAYAHTPEGMVSIQNKVFGFKNGVCYQHNSTSDYSLNIYGQTYKARVMPVFNSLPNQPKIYLWVKVEGNILPSLTYLLNEPSLSSFNQYDLSEQVSDLMDFDYQVREGQMYALVYRNKLQPTATGLNLTGLINGDPIRAIVLKVLLEFQPTTQPLELRFLTFGFAISKGNTK